MKKLYVSEILKSKQVGQEVELWGWIEAKRAHSSIIFLDLVDSSGSIQITVNRDAAPVAFHKAQGIVPESSVRITGIVGYQPQKEQKEIAAQEVEVIGGALLSVSPRPRTSFDIFAPQFADLILRERHLYLRNQKLMAVLQFRHKLLGVIHNWFRKQGYVEIHAPVLTQLPLYEDKTAFSLDFFGNKVFLTQCVAFYLESAIYAFEKVYTIGPSFRAEESKSKRHLAEYWHVKAEIAFADYEDIICFTESMMAYIVNQVESETREELEKLAIVIDVERLSRIPYPRISYADALQQLGSKDKAYEWGRSLSAGDLKRLSLGFDTPFWVTGLPSEVEPFPYDLQESDPRVTKTADLIAPDGYGELLGVAEKIYDADKLLERMREKNRDKDERYHWYYELRQFGSIPHSGFGMGVERIIRWLLKLNHVRDAIPFPRLFNRPPYP